MSEKTGTRKCPYCKEEIKADAIKCKHCQSRIAPENPSHNGTCPYCKESINVEAIKCKHCKSSLLEKSGYPHGGGCKCGDHGRNRGMGHRTSHEAAAEHIHGDTPFFR